MQQYLEALRDDEILDKDIFVGIDVKAQRDWLRENGTDVSEMSEQEINRFHTDLREVLLYIKYSKEKEKLVDLIQTDDGFQNMKTETVVMLNTLTNSKLKFNEEKEETSMCLAIDELREEAKQEGIEFGRRELIEKMLMNHETMDKIKEYTGYTQEKIDEIAKELSAR